jgi:hypothetical protein
MTQADEKTTMPYGRWNYGLFYSRKRRVRVFVGGGGGESFAMMMTT